MPLPMRLAALATFKLLAIPTGAAQCFHVDGTEAPGLKACTPDTPFSACCQSEDLCMSSGLCYSEQPGFEGFIFESGCTDKSGRDIACPHFCPDRGPPVKDWNVLQCNPGVFCCRHSSDTGTCCAQADEFLIFATPGNLMVSRVTGMPQAGPNITSTVTLPPGESATVTVTSRPLPMDFQQPDASLGSGKSPALVTAECQPDKSALVGGAVGGVLGTALLSALGLIAFLLIRQAKQQSPMGQFQYSPSGQFKVMQQAASVSQPNSINSLPEIPGDQKQVHELDKIKD
ncbi:hypothetical protein HJFPF1_11047 [Paramyrothecium foliicola]|nr:hypothetical protein HJFPF1_11047 [Paramyrothecium foliicola]